MPTAARPPKVQRWIDLIAALLRFHYPIPFEKLAQEVPAYGASAKKRDAVMRMFERDKDELRAFGIPIESVANDDGVPDRYRLKPSDFYLPYLAVIAEAGGAAAPARAKSPGYAALPSLAFEPDELDCIVRAARRVEHLGNPTLARDAATALRKLAFDLAIAAPHHPPDEIIAAEQAAGESELLDQLDDAIRNRKTVAFDYWSMQRDAHSRRTVDPLGLVFKSSAWYLIGRDRDADALRHFRVRRITNAAVNASRSQSADFDPPRGFDLGAHTASRHAWELGDGDALEARVHFAGDRGVIADAMALGAAVPGRASERQFQVRRVESFARWLLSFGGDAVPLGPEAIVASFRDLAQRTAALYKDPA